MTPEELRLLKDAVDAFDYPKNSLVRKAIEHIDEQAKEIRFLKNAVILKECESTYWELHGSGSPREKSTPIQYADEAKRQLKQELPEMGWE